MAAQEATEAQTGKVERLLGFLERDPANGALIGDAAHAAYEARRFALARQLVDRRAAGGGLSPDLVNLSALIALGEARYEDAVSHLVALQQDGHDAPQIRFNHAWAAMMLQRYGEANEQLDMNAIRASPLGPSLKIQALHHLEKLEEALQTGKELAGLFPKDEALMGTLATLAMDADRMDLARHYASLAGEDAEGLAARGLFALDEQDSAAALEFFDRAIEKRGQNPRAWVGKGLALLANGEAGKAAQAIQHGADLFEDHLGSWVGAGWAYFIAGDQDAARAMFQKVIALDGNFAEGHGGLAVLDILSGDRDAARRNASVALRLDRASLGGTLATTMLLRMAGDDAGAEKIRAAALSSPIGPRGQTLAQAIAGTGTQFFRR